MNIRPDMNIEKLLNSVPIPTVQLTDMQDSCVMPQFITSEMEVLHKQIVGEQEQYIARQLFSLNIDKDILTNQVAEIHRLNELLTKYKELEESNLLHRLPCKIGQSVWVIRKYKGIPHIQSGIVSEMFFTHEMKLMIVVKHIGRGEFGKNIFNTEEAALEAVMSEM